ncbi:MAG: GTP cyclohydrolase I FolE2 [Proteobacteria bacterium]|nr:MAG: GTP cyclohydrolase I FolE2 [Pseudomonadota bacterium]
MDKPSMPDVASEFAQEPFASLQQVGMGAIEVPILLVGNDQSPFRIPAKVDAKVSLDLKSSRGIHMSRLYLKVQELLPSRPLDYKLMQELATSFLESHKDLSSTAFANVRFEAPLLRPALRSQNKAWRSYPVVLSVQSQAGQNKHWVEAQRSEAVVRVQVRDAQSGFAFERLIDVVEEALQTPVQGAVKREDEQEFALRNGQNLMFCEDACRRIGAALSNEADVVDFRIEVKHLESLHPHNAEALMVKGLTNGMTN